jgi:hypothetical protein
MSYTGAIAAIKTALEAVAGIRYVLDYEPATIQDTPMIYLTNDGGEREFAADVSSYTYNVTATLVVNWQDNDQCETTVTGLLTTIMESLDADLSLGGALNGGAALFRSWAAGYEQIGSRVYRIVDFAAEITEQAC